MADGLYNLTVKELEAASRALSARCTDLGRLAHRFEQKGDQEAASQLREEENDISLVNGCLLRAIRNREKEDREREYLEKGEPATAEAGE
jgi:hypothetical protein